MPGTRIGELAARTGVSTPTIRYYERVGLLPSAPRSASGYRRYAERTVQELQFVRQAQALGFSLDEVVEILVLTRAGRKPCTRVLSLTRNHLSAVDARIRRLQEFRAFLAAELKRWEAQETLTTREGLCGFIAEAVVPGTLESEGSPATLRPATRGRPARTSSRS